MPNQGEFTWSKLTQGYILSSFYYGYVITQIPGGWLAGRYGGKNVLGFGMLLSILATLLIPVAARLNVYLVIVLRIITGLGMGVVFPSMHCLWGKWAPPLERATLLTSCYSGTSLGTVLGMSISGLLCGSSVDNGWPLIFYVFGGVALFWFLAWMYLVHNSPQIHPRISDVERKYIEKCIGPMTIVDKDPIPWKSIFTSPAVWGIVACHMCNNWGSYTILGCAPMYMRDVLKFDVKTNGALSALPYVCMYVAALGGGQFADFLRVRQILTTVAIRKILQSTAMIAPAICLVIMGYLSCENRYAAVALLTIAVTFTALGRSAYAVNHVDIAPRYSGLLFGISNTAGTIPGMIAPTVAGAITPDGLREEWQMVFFIAAGVYVLGAVVFSLMARGEVQDWARVVKPAPEELADLPLNDTQERIDVVKI